MPGENCSIVGCGTCRNQKELGIFKIPSNKEQHAKWRADVLAVVTKDREVDSILRHRISKGNVYVCERHYDPSQIVCYPTRKVLKEGAVPSLNLPVKSFPQKQVTPRGTNSITKRQEAVEKVERYYVENFDSLQKELRKSKIHPWQMTLSTFEVTLTLKQNPYVIPKFEVIINSELEVIVRVFGWLFNFEKSVKTEKIEKLLYEIRQMKLCQGITCIEILNSFAIRHHTISKKFSSDSQPDTYFRNSVEDHFYRSPDCKLLIDSSEDSCLCCQNFVIKEKKDISMKKSSSTKPAKLNAPISATSSSRLLSTIQQQRAENKELTMQVKELKREIEKCSVKVDASLHQDLKAIFKASERQLTPFLKLFWEEQMKYIEENPSQVRYHPMVIKFCLNLYAKSPAAYKHLRFDEKNGTGALILPSQRTLRDFRNYIKPKTGFNPDVVKELMTLTKNFSHEERFVVLSFDEMKIQEDLVWNKHTGELVGFVDLGDENLNEATLKQRDSLATHALVFHVKSVVNPLSYSLGCFATDGVSSYHLFSIFWRAVFLLELHCVLFVAAATSDGASSNRGFFKMHKGYVADDGSVVYRTPNLFATGRFIYFFSDIPHLLKTLRNNLLHSGSEGFTRFMFNHGFHLLWKHVRDFYIEDSSSSLRFLPKLTPEHIYLTSYSKMNVRYAAQILSSSVGKVLLEFGPMECQETANFCLLVDQFFDCGNVRNTKEWMTKKKPFLKPYSSTTDERFDWLIDVFLKYFEDWLAWIKEEHKDLPPEQKARMFIAWQTYEGIQISTKSLIDCTKFLLNEGITYVLTEKFCQDDLENYFGKQRALGQRRDNPNIQQFRINDNIIKSSISVAPIGGNCQRKKDNWKVDNTPLPKKARK